MDNISTKKTFFMKVTCPNFRNIHGKTIKSGFNNKFYQLQDLAIPLQTLLPEKTITIDDRVCKNCYNYFVSLFQVPSNIAVIQDRVISDTSDVDSDTDISESFHNDDKEDDEEKAFLVNELNTQHLKIINASPLKNPHAVGKVDEYLKKKERV